jgi:transcriptional regulator with GAF, ATPase, and Fis domain
LAEEQKITVSQEYISTLEKKVEDLRSLIDVSSIIASTLDFNDLINLVMEKVKKVMDAEACSILLYNSETDKLELRPVPFFFITVKLTNWSSKLHSVLMSWQQRP